MELETVKGIGPSIARKLTQLGIDSVESLISYFPYNYYYYNIVDINEETDSEITIRGLINTEPKVMYFKKNLNRLTFKILVNEMLINVVIFNRAFMKNNLHVNQEVNLHGKYDKQKNTFTASNIFIKKFDGELIEPRYHLVKGIANKEVNRLINIALISGVNITSLIPEYISNKHDFISEEQAYKYIHNPQNITEIKLAKLRLIYEELFSFMFKINLLKIQNTEVKDALLRKVSKTPIDKFVANLPYDLTDDQNTSVTEIYQDLTSGKRMNRLLLGDVGSGKTIVSIIALYINYLAGYQGAMMVPTEILAVQQFKTIQQLLSVHGVKSELLVGSMSQKEKKVVLAKLEMGQIDLIVGTHSLIGKNVNFSNLGLVITDEQHRFGVNQRGILQNKGAKCDILYLSATPIPRTYALTIYGDMATSFIKSKITGRKDILTKVVKEKDIKIVLQKMYEEIKLGHQIFVVAPLIEENETSNLNDIKKLKEKFDMAFNNKVKIEILHGKMSKQEKEDIMNAYQNNEIKVLISTTVIEVGIDVKNSTMMVIYNAERFGLATLHQLRGRVGRNDTQSYCYLICNSEIKRLKVMEESNDGFYISEKDFELRGQGDLFGIKQSGDMTFKLANLRADYKILLQTKKDTEEFIRDNIANNFSDYPEYQRIFENITIY